MSRITQDDYPKIAQALAAGERVAEIAKQWNCTAANIYAIKRKLEIKPVENTGSVDNTIQPEPENEPETAEKACDITRKSVSEWLNKPVETIEVTVMDAKSEREIMLGLPHNAIVMDTSVESSVKVDDDVSDIVLAKPVEAVKNLPEELVLPAEALGMKIAGGEREVPDLSKKGKVKGAKGEPALKGNRLRSAFILRVRDGEGEQQMLPSRSLEDLLAGIRPVLRNAARADEPVWFSIQPIDMEDIGAE